MAEKKESKGSPLLDMMADLAREPKLVKAFQEDENKLMARYGVPKKQQAALKSALKDLQKGNTGKIQKVVADETIVADTCFLSLP